MDELPAGGAETPGADLLLALPSAGAERMSVREASDPVATMPPTSPDLATTPPSPGFPPTPDAGAMSAAVTRAHSSGTVASTGSVAASTVTTPSAGRWVSRWASTVSACTHPSTLPSTDSSASCPPEPNPDRRVSTLPPSPSSTTSHDVSHGGTGTPSPIQSRSA